MQGLEAQLKVKKELEKKEGEVFELETWLADMTSKGMYWESLVMVANKRLDTTHTIAEDTDRRAKEAEAKAQVAEEKPASAASRTTKDFKNFKNSKDFKDEVGEVVLDAYLKGFVECKAKVSVAYSDLDLKDIFANAGEQEGEEGGEEAKRAEPIIAATEKIDEGTNALNDQASVEEVTKDSTCKTDSIQETMAMVMVELNTVVETVKVGLEPAIYPEK